MKITIDLPSDLGREMKLLAIHEGRQLKDVAVDLLMRGLSAGDTIANNTARQAVLLSAPVGAPEMTPERVREILEETP